MVDRGIVGAFGGHEVDTPDSARFVGKTVPGNCRRGGRYVPVMLCSSRAIMAKYSGEKRSEVLSFSLGGGASELILDYVLGEGLANKVDGALCEN
mmetsp:Transcript_21147/g.38038  ORF Transcript_21147/g.38038 Transcript_21147/m.38038 type:complete len:95 (+) Transcript_21147:3-287(+)